MSNYLACVNDFALCPQLEAEAEAPREGLGSRVWSHIQQAWVWVCDSISTVVSSISSWLGLSSWLGGGEGEQTQPSAGDLMV
jgi:hypothetical protein